MEFDSIYKGENMYVFYKIKDPDFEYYSSGLKHGYIHKSKKGKTFNSLGALKNHLIMAQRFDNISFNLFYDNWLVIKITENGVENIGVVKDFKQRKD